MEHSSFDEYNDIFTTSFELISDSNEKRSQKRKWREIETYKDRQRLRQELTDLRDYCC
jgi:hypothetical protein